MEQETVNILLVNDQPPALLALESILSDLGGNLVKAQSGEEALQRVLDHEFAVILLDVNMPEMDGFETAALIRQRQLSESTPIIFVTAHNVTEIDLITGYELGAVDYIFAPVVPKILRAKVAAFVDLYRKTRRLVILSHSLESQLQEISLLNRQLEAVNHELDAFSYSISHDLRAPLRAMVGFSSVLLETSLSQLDDEAAKYLRRIHEAGLRMTQLIDDLLAFSHLGRQPVNKQSVSLADLVRLTFDELPSNNDRRQVEITVGDLPRCQADPALLKQALVNLLGNALKFTGKRDVAHIEVGSQHIDGETVYFVRDNGAGFDMRYADKLFGVFQRLHGAKEYAGTGVGLAIVQRVIQRHGGRIWAESEVEKGATFYFTLKES